MFNHILAPLDESPLAECALPHAVTLARAFNARITLLHVVERDTFGGPGGAIIDPLRWQVRKAEARAYLNQVAGRFEEIGLQAHTAILEGPAAERIIEFAHDHDVGLIAISTHGQSGLSGWNVSSVVQKVILRAHVPVMIVRAYACPTTAISDIGYRRLLVPLDGTRRAEYVLPLATTLAHASGSRLILAYVVSKPEVPRRMPLSGEEGQLVERITELNLERGRAYLERMSAQFPPQTETRLVASEDPAAALHDLVAQENIDVVALGARGHTGETRWPYGCVALNLIAYGTTPLLIVQDLSPEELESTRAEVMAREVKGH